MHSHNLNTLLAHADHAAATATEHATHAGPSVTPGLTLSTTYTQPVPADLVSLIAAAEREVDGSELNNGHAAMTRPPYVYSRYGSPVVDRVEAVLGALEGAYAQEGDQVHAVVYASGLTAIHAAISVYKPTRIISAVGYHGTAAAIAEYVTNRPTTVHARVDPLALVALASSPNAALPAALAAISDPAHTVVIVETPANPLGTILPLAAIASRLPTGTHLVVDGTLAPPPLQYALSIRGVSAVMHSATKYLGGHSDLLAGVVAVHDPNVASALRASRGTLGGAPGAMEAWLLLRSVRTLGVRVKAQVAGAAALAKWLEGARTGQVKGIAAGAVSAVHHGSISTIEEASWVAAQMPGGHSPVLSVELASAAAARALPHVLKLATAATSLGGVETLVEWRRQHDNGVSDKLVRVSVGIEDASDLIADWDRAIRVAVRVGELAASSSSSVQ
ncbi:pyridoxal phosphate-dependent transferase [Blastocladiella britannica]|nr:pyridoxal phosphate-dependent transferase [Blastocladiella britannica]